MNNDVTRALILASAWSLSASAQVPAPTDGDAPATSSEAPAPAPTAPPSDSQPDVADEDVADETAEADGAALTARNDDTPTTGFGGDSPSGRAAVREHFAPVIDRPGGLTSDEAAEAAVKISPQARAARAQVRSADAQVGQVTWQYLPRLTLTASYTRLSPQPDVGGDLGGNLVATTAPAGPVPPGSQLVAVDATQAFQQIEDQWYLNAGLVIPLSDYALNLSKAVTGAKTALQSAELQEKAERVNAAANARIAYYEWARTKLTVREAQKSVERAQKQLETLQARLAAGRASRADVLRSDAFLAATELDLRRSNTREAIAREQLNVQMTGGEQSQPDWEIGEDVLAEPAIGDYETVSVEELQREALQQRLEIRALDGRAKALREKRALEKTQGYPRLEAFGNATYANPNPRVVPQTEEWLGTWDVGVRMTWTLNELGNKYSPAAQTNADVAEVEANRDSVEFAVRQEVLAEYRTLQEARLATSTAHRGLQASQAAYRDRILLFENGRATSLDLLEAETSLVQARLDLVTAYIAQRIALVRLDHAVGRDIEDVVGAVDG